MDNVILVMAVKRKIQPLTISLSTAAFPQLDFCLLSTLRP